MTIEEFNAYNKNLLEIAKTFNSLFMEKAKHDKYMRKGFSKKIGKNYEKRWWQAFKIFDIDLASKLKASKSKKDIPTIKDIERIDSQLQETKQGLIAFFNHLDKQRDEIVLPSTQSTENQSQAVCDAFETKEGTSTVVEQAEQPKEQNEANGEKA